MPDPLQNFFIWASGKAQGMSDEQIRNVQAMLEQEQQGQASGQSMAQIAQTTAASPEVQSLMGGLRDIVGPGTGLDLGTTAEDRAAAAPLGATLAGQAQTGGGAWEDALRKGTLASQNAAMAVGQSTPGVGYQTALRNIGNAQAAAKQRAAGQANILRAQQQQGAQGLYGQFLQGQGGQDIAQAGAQADVAQQQRETQAAQRQQAQQNTAGVISGAAQAIPYFLSKGGKVPGTPEVFGDDSRNDTVPAWLSPKEIVLPLHVTQAPDAPERAAAFVRAVQNKEHPSNHFDDGGTVPGQVSVPSDVLHTPFGNFANPLATDIQAPSEATGAILHTAPYEANRQSVLANQQMMQKGAMGQGPSVAPQEMMNATDANIAAAMQAQARPSTSGALISGLGAAESGAAGKGAETAMGEQRGAQEALMQSLYAQRAQDLALAQRKQQAMQRNAMLNMGLDLSHQAMLRNLFAGAGQGIESGVSAFGGKSPMSAPNADALAQPTGSSPSEWANPYGGYAHGGEVADHEKKRASAFLKALGRAA